MTSAIHSLDQPFILQNVTGQFDDLTSSSPRDASPLGKLQSAHGHVDKSVEDAGTDRRWSAHDHTNPITLESGRSPSNVAPPATV